MITGVIMPHDIDDQKKNLESNKLDKYNEQKQKVREKIKESDQCKRFLDSLKIDLNSVINALDLQRPYDGTGSTITRLTAGLTGPDVDISKYPGSLEAIVQVRQDFKGGGTYKPKAETAIFTGPNRLPGATVADRSDVYFSSSGLGTTTILHEALHSLFGLGDRALAERLGLGKFSTDEEASKAISKALKKNKCSS